MGFFSWIIFGAIAGWVAGKLTGRDQSMGLFLNIIVGIVGASIGGFIIRFFGGPGVTGFNFRSLAVAVVGAVVLLAVLNKIKQK